jgi:translation initiation factor IF-3
MIGIVSLNEALSKAKSVGLDLVEISAGFKGNVSVCKIINFSKFRYEKERKEKEIRKKQKNLQIKEIRIRPRISEHDLNIKIKCARDFISFGNKVQITIVFSGREIQHKELGNIVLEKIKSKLIDISNSELKNYSNNTSKIFLILSPKKHKDIKVK